MSLLLRRSPAARLLTDEECEKMLRIENCLHCNACAKRCPYGLNTPELLKANLADYKSFRDGYLSNSR